MKKLIYILPVLLLLPFFAGCKKDDIQTGIMEGYIECTAEEKATTFCNYVYSPVCGDDGETYGNICSACSSQNINSYKTGECNCDAENGICSIIEEEFDTTELEETHDIVIKVPRPDF